MSVMAKEAATLFLEALGRAQGALEDMRRAYDCMMVQTHASEHVYLSFRTAVEECAQVGDIIHVEHETFGTLQFRVVEVLQETIGKRPLVIWTDRPITRRAYDEPSEKWPFGCGAWETSSLRKWLNGSFFYNFSEADKVCIQRRVVTGATDPDWFWLLHPAHVGLAAPDGARKRFAWFQTPERRILKEADGGAVWWWLRGPVRRGRCFARFANGFGNLDCHNPCSNNSVTAACIIY
jgi:hypothetical protein